MAKISNVFAKEEVKKTTHLRQRDDGKSGYPKDQCGTADLSWNG